ncbi:hypothetical protein HDV00_002663 [Rhizophlyctis rosea]|nr:hypothetical protein HDV00_002663 [Rhizophlyctis rosea]
MAKSSPNPTLTTQTIQTLLARIRSSGGSIDNDEVFDAILYEARRLRWKRFEDGVVSKPERRRKEKSRVVAKGYDKDKERAVMRDMYERVVAGKGEGDLEGVVQVLLNEVWTVLCLLA